MPTQQNAGQQNAGQDKRVGRSDFSVRLRRTVWVGDGRRCQEISVSRLPAVDLRFLSDMDDAKLPLEQNRSRTPVIHRECRVSEIKDVTIDRERAEYRACVRTKSMLFRACCSFPCP